MYIAAPPMSSDLMTVTETAEDQPLPKIETMADGATTAPPSSFPAKVAQAKEPVRPPGQPASIDLAISETKQIIAAITAALDQFEGVLAMLERIKAEGNLDERQLTALRRELGVLMGIPGRR